MAFPLGVETPSFHAKTMVKNTNNSGVVAYAIPSP